MCVCVCVLFLSVDVGKHVEGSIIQSSKFPAAQRPDPNLPSKIETEYWPCPPSLATMGNSYTHTHTHINAHTHMHTGTLIPTRALGTAKAPAARR